MEENQKGEGGKEGETVIDKKQERGGKKGVRWRKAKRETEEDKEDVDGGMEKGRWTEGEEKDQEGRREMEGGEDGKRGRYRKTKREM